MINLKEHRSFVSIDKTLNYEKYSEDVLYRIRAIKGDDNETWCLPVLVTLFSLVVGVLVADIVQQLVTEVVQIDVIVQRLVRARRERQDGPHGAT